MSKLGTVYLVGAGPGDAGLLTLRGAELISRADVLVYDALVNPDLLTMAPASAEVIYAGKRANAHAIPQEELNQLLVTKARQGKTVVRLKGGDPYVFGRGAEEAEELATAKIPFEIVPGVTSAVAAPAYAGIPITHRDCCSSFTVLTGHERPDKAESSIDWAQLARDPGTKIILMGVERIGGIMEKLLAHGLASKTPVALVRWGTTGRQQTIEGTVGDIAEKIQRANFQAPAVTVIGDVVSRRARLNWFEKRPLFGQRVVVTRTRQQASQLSARLRELGAAILEIPTIRITEPNDFNPVKDAIVGITSYSWLVFTSPNGVDHFAHWFFKAYDDIRSIGACRIAAVGPATAARLRALHLQVDLQPEEFTAAALAKAFKKHGGVENLNVCLFRAQVASAELPQSLHELGAIVDEIAVYKTVPETEDRNGAVARLQEDGADWITFASASSVESFHNRFDLPKATKEHGWRLLSIGPETTAALTKLKLKPTVEAKPHNIDGMVAALLKSAGQSAGR
ncbi:MAG: uroporphyrinogen-III C-methyltransferase [Pedosphaera sp.]|nr:uroporphyrinogen-III C-methyltransferase [Pedosphaera sp.]MSU43444.1 uroporphyrinogen-III C-methyltransferase [Pedosphaera sp.]